MDKIQEIIPQFFYDFICRVIPGTIFFAFIINDVRIHPLLNTTFPELTSIMAFLVCGYVVGFTTDCISEILFYLIDPRLARVINKFKKKKIYFLDATKILWKLGIEPSKELHSLLAKYNAEKVLFRTLTLSWLLISIFDVYIAAYLSWMQKFFVFMVLWTSYFLRLLIALRFTQTLVEVYGDDSKR